MRIVIDMQGAQTQSRFRGIGRYSLGLALALARNADGHEVHLVLNAAFQKSILDIRQVFKELVPQEHIHVFSVPLPVMESTPENAWRNQVAELIREHFLEQLDPDIILITSLFEGYIDNAITSIGRFSSKRLTAVILYDLIPYLNSKRYLPEKNQYRYYMKKIEYLKDANFLFSISESSKNECAETLKIPKNKILNISTAVDESFQTINLQKEDIQKLLQRYNITRKLVMYTPGGFDLRKNFDGLIKAYALLSKKHRAEYQLVIVSKVQEIDQSHLYHLAQKEGLTKDELILTGYVPDDDLIALYNICTLFVFPSKHEGFGLPILEAMACGAAVIGSNTTSIPEVIGWEEALFDPNDPVSISEKMKQCLVDDNFKASLLQNAKKQTTMFSWDKSAKKVLNTIDGLIKEHNENAVPTVDYVKKPKLAYFSPMPPLKSGISDYSTDLLPFLNTYYEITLILDQTETHHLQNAFSIQTPEWFLAHSKTFDRVIYQFGNSPFHSYMLPILKQFPGVIVLHDFFISGLLFYDEMKHNTIKWSEALFYGHGYWALKERFNKNLIEKTKIKYPCNLELVQHARQVIVHSNYSKSLLESWYGENQSASWSVIPLLRFPITSKFQNEARQTLNLKPNDFIVCSFGFLDSTKLNHRLLDAWLNSKLSHIDNCKLIYVGENHGGDYGFDMTTKIKNSNFRKNIMITGWTDSKLFHTYLEAADVGVQLRTQSRGETSAAVLDCMNYGLATIVNANGAMAELSENAVHMLPDTFDNNELITALEKLYDDKDYRETLGKKAKEIIHTLHDPSHCAKQYHDTIESSYRHIDTDYAHLLTSISEINSLSPSTTDILQTAQAIASSRLVPIKQKQLFVDISNIIRNDLKTGIERVVHAQLLELIKSPPKGFRIEPVYLQNDNGWCYWYARQYTCNLLNIPLTFPNEPVEINSGDVFYGLDFYPDGVSHASKAGLYKRYKAHGVSISFLIYDLLPVTHSEFFPQDADYLHARWLREIISVSDHLICISHSVADELKSWITNNIAKDDMNRNIKISAVHLGADIKASSPSQGLIQDERILLKQLKNKTSFLMVGTIEPRKGHLQTLDAFETLWDQGYDINLVIVGKEGWKALDDAQRLTIPKIISRLNNHSQLNKHLFWFNEASDEFLEKIYTSSSCLIVSSQAEGFGLPLIEAAQHGLPIIARDIPIFKEVAKEAAFYFEDSLNPKVIVKAISQWLDHYESNTHQRSDSLHWITWNESTKQVIDSLKLQKD